MGLRKRIVGHLTSLTAWLQVIRYNEMTDKLIAALRTCLSLRGKMHGGLLIMRVYARTAF